MLIIESNEVFIMKNRKLFAFCIALLLIVISVSITAKADNENNKFVVTFRAELSNPVEYPEDFGLLTVKYNETDVCVRMVFERTLDEGTVLDAGLVPDVHIPEASKSVKFEGWDIDPYGYTVTDDITFTARFNNDNTIPVRFDAKVLPDIQNSEEVPYNCFAPANSSSYIIMVENGYTLTEADMPQYITENPSNVGTNKDTISKGWDESPVGKVVTEPMHFTHSFSRAVCVLLLYPTSAQSPEMHYVEYGESLTAPKVPDECEHKLFCGWSASFENILPPSPYIISAKYHVRGDVNMDDALNTGDAALVLRKSVGLTELNEYESRLADINSDGSINAGDAVAILRMSVDLP